MSLRNRIRKQGILAMTVTIQISNSDNKLTQGEWAFDTTLAPNPESNKFSLPNGFRADKPHY